MTIETVTQAANGVGKEVLRCGLYGVAAYFLLHFFMEQVAEDKKFYQQYAIRDQEVDSKQAAALDKIGDGTQNLAVETKYLGKQVDQVGDAVRNFKSQQKNQYVMFMQEMKTLHPEPVPCEE